MLCTNRLPNGDQRVFRQIFSIKEKEEKNFSLFLPKIKTEELLQKIPLPEILVEKRTESVSITGESLLFWFQPEEEPSVHLLKELLMMKEELRPLGRKMFFFLSEKGKTDPLVNTVINAIGNIHLAFDEEKELLEKLAREMFQDPGQLPFVLITNAQKKGSYCAAGYHVGTAAMVYKVWQLLQQQPQG
ncbi:MAG: hypothetical protein GX786_05110 [Clostridiales bacterium]|nr:hypothetical protein [Clostridiales bacterium]